MSPLIGLLAVVVWFAALFFTLRGLYRFVLREASPGAAGQALGIAILVLVGSEIAPWLLTRVYADNIADQFPSTAARTVFTGYRPGIATSSVVEYPTLEWASTYNEEPAMLRFGTALPVGMLRISRGPNASTGPTCPVNHVVKLAPGSSPRDLDTRRYVCLAVKIVERDEAESEIANVDGKPFRIGPYLLQTRTEALKSRSDGRLFNAIVDVDATGGLLLGSFLIMNSPFFDDDESGFFYSSRSSKVHTAGLDPKRFNTREFLLTGSIR